MTLVKVLLVVLIVAPLTGILVQYIWPDDWPMWVGDYVGIVMALVALGLGIPRIRRHFRGWRIVALGLGIVGGAAVFYVLYLMVGLGPRE